MLRIIIYTTATGMLMLGAASAQAPQKMGLPGYTNTLRSDLERNNDKEIDRAYQSTRKVVPEAKKEQTDPWGDVRPQPPAAAKNK